MLRIEKTVFISYRRTNIYTALAIHQNLTHRGYDVFFDYESIKAGDFEQNILGSIASRAHFVAILTPSALERCAEPNDWLRREIEHALKHKRNIIPLTFDGFDFDDIPRYLPAHIAQPLGRYNSLEIPHSVRYLDKAIDFLVEYLNIPLEMVLHPPAPAVRAEEVRQQQAITAEPSVPESKLTAQEYFELGKKSENNDKKIDYYNQAIQLNPQYADAFNNRGSAKHDKGDYDGAIDDYSRAIQINPYLTYAFNKRGVVKAQKGDWDGAIDDYNHAIQLDPNIALTFNNRGILKAQKDDYDGAFLDFEQALSINPNDQNAKNNLQIMRDILGY